ncbi:hypothetical protein GUITHDRAFT_79750, partial [Guillardia theta CCMP2712]
MAAAEGNYRVVELLLEEGADKNQKDRWGNTPLQDAVNANQGPVVQLLLWLEHGVDPNVSDCDMRTPLHVAASEGYDKIVEYLIAKGSNVNVEDNNYDAIILSNIEQKVAFLNQRRKTEHVAAFCGASSRGELEKML